MSSFLIFCTICVGDPNLLTPSKLEKILHLCIFTDKNNGIVQDNSHGHAILQSLNKMKGEKKQQQQRGKEIKRGPQNKASQSIFIMVQDFYF